MYLCEKCGVLHPPKDYSLTRGDWGGIRYKVHVHELRDLFRTEWHRSQADPSVAEHCMGHTVDPLQYDKIMRDHTYARAHYLRALPYLNILSENPRVLPRAQVDDRLSAQSREISELRDKVDVLSKSLLLLAEDKE